MERPVTLPDPSQPPPSPVPEARRNFPAACTLVVVQGVVHTSDVSQPGGSSHSDAIPRHASLGPPRLTWPEILARHMCSRRVALLMPPPNLNLPKSVLLPRARTRKSRVPPPKRRRIRLHRKSLLSPHPAYCLSPTSIDVLGTLGCAFIDFYVVILANKKHGIVLKRRDRCNCHLTCFRFF
jgi:hypothetical protein